MSEPTTYTLDEQTALLMLARRTLTQLATHTPVSVPDLDELPPSLAAERACFVTLRCQHDRSLRGCTGTLVARRPLAEEVVFMTEQTAFHDPRFPPVAAHEIDSLTIEVSVLTPPCPLAYSDPYDLVAQLQPGIDGVTLQHEYRRATFLPQVWESYPDPEEFLSLLSLKMGLASHAWRTLPMTVHTYQAIMFEECRE